MLGTEQTWKKTQSLEKLSDQRADRQVTRGSEALSSRPQEKEAPHAPGTHRKEWSVRSGQESVLGRSQGLPTGCPLLFPHTIPAPGVINSLLQVAYSGGLWTSNGKIPGRHLPTLPGFPSSPSRGKIKENKIAPLFSISFLQNLLSFVWAPLPCELLDTL